VGKTNLTTFGSPLEKFWKNTLVAPPLMEKILPRLTFTGSDDSENTY